MMILTIMMKMMMMMATIRGAALYAAAASDNKLGWGGSKGERSDCISDLKRPAHLTLHTCMCICTFVFVFVHLYLYLYICMCICTFVFVFVHYTNCILDLPRWTSCTSYTAHLALHKLYLGSSPLNILHILHCTLGTAQIVSYIFTVKRAQTQQHI